MSIIKDDIAAVKSSSVQYTVSPIAIQQLIAQDLNVPPHKVKVNYVIEEVGGDPMDRFPGHKEVTKIQVTITG